MKLTLPFTTLLLSLACTLPAAMPIDPEANPKVHAVLTYLHSLESRTTERILSGQFTGYANQRNADLMQLIPEMTGETPALIGIDYADHPRGNLDWKRPNEEAIRHWKAGGLVTLSVHMYNPANPAGGGLRDKGVDFKALLTPGTDTYTRWRFQLDQIATGLAELQEAGVVVLFRPFHEMNGNWFWWCDQPKADFLAVWEQVYTLYTQEKKLHNLLWVYGPNHGDNADDWYPGDHRIDVVGLDAYTDFIDPEHIKGYAALARHPKPFGFTEFGPGSPADPKGDYDYRRLLQGFAEHFPRTTFFLAWDDKWTPARNQYPKEFFADPVLANLRDLPSFQP